MLSAVLVASLTKPPSVVAVPDLPRLAPDGAIVADALGHDSRSDLYRVPFGAVPTGEGDVTLRIRAAAGDLTEATLRVYDAKRELQALIPMEIVATDTTAGENGFDYWQATLPVPAEPTILYYRFIVRDGAASAYLEDDAALDGGDGQVYADSPDASWQINVYDAGFTTPDWAEGAVVYQIFPDRFFNGDPGNDPRPDVSRETEGPSRYRYGDVYGNPIVPMQWTDLPEGHCRAYEVTRACDEEPLGRDFFGGDLAGITAKLDMLEDLGVTVIYLNPIFAAPSNHRYDTSDYFEIDPDLGTRAEFDTLLRESNARGIRIVLDGVFNHTSSDSPFFDRAKRFPESGACESSDSPYANWYVLLPGPPAKCHGGQTYEDWFGFDTLPVLTEHPEVRDVVYGPDGVALHWLEAGAAGWRLDVMNEISHGFLADLRTAIKSDHPDALIVGEEWGDASPWLLGTEADTAMNYRFRRAVIGLVNGQTADPDGAIPGLAPSEFASQMDGVREDYPPEAFAVLLNLVDSHDTARILWTLTPGPDDPAVKESAAALDEGKVALRLVATLQLTWPGMASIYYGDEAGLTGHDDPDDRRPYPWGSEDATLRDHYAALARLRAEHESLRSGDVRFMLADDEAGTLAFLRRTDAEAAITVLNLSTEGRDVLLDVAGLLPDGARVADALAGGALTVGDGRLQLRLPPRSSAVLITVRDIDLTAPATPSALAADAGPGEVALSWDGVEGATSYSVWRSLVADGGYELVGETGELSFTDRFPRNGVLYHYAVAASDEGGNTSPRSTEVTALPALVVSDARLDAPPAVEQTLSAIEEGPPVGALVRVDGVTGASGPTVGIRAEIGFGPEGTDPVAEPGWTWTTATFEGDVAGADRFVARLRPEEAGTHAVSLRVSTTGGTSWTYADRDGHANGYQPEQAVRLAVLPPSDREPPPPPDAPVVSLISASSLTIAWDPVAAGDLFRYEIWRADTPGGPYQRVGTATDITFTDDSVRSGASYAYVITAQDASFNRSEYSEEAVAAAESREVLVTFTVAVPSHTPPEETVHIAGDFQGWDPGATPMTRVDEFTWTITLPFPEGDPPEYKYTRGSWEAVEKDSECGEIPNRTFTVTFGTDGTQSIEDSVGKWRDVDACG